MKKILILIMLGRLLSSAYAGDAGSLTDKALVPFEVLKKSASVSINNGGYGSDITAHPTKYDHFYGVTDRGPNAKYTDKNGKKGKIFPVPEYIPRIGLFKFQSGKAILVRQIILKRPDGTPISGLPNEKGTGGTGEVPWDTKMNVLRYDNYGIDSEGIVAMKDGTFWLSDEYGPHMVHFDANGVEIGRINPFPHDKRTIHNLPLEFKNRRANRGMEGLALSGDETTLVGVMQSTMYHSRKMKSDIVRIVSVDIKSGKIKQYIYKQNKKNLSLSGIANIQGDDYYIIERDGKMPLKEKDAIKQIYKISLSDDYNIENIHSEGSIVQNEKLGLTIDGLTLEEYREKYGWDKLALYGVKPVRKTLVLDLVKDLNYPHDKLEGIWVKNDGTIGVINDDDFAVDSAKGKVIQKYIDNEKNIVDKTMVYIVKP